MARSLGLFSASLLFAVAAHAQCLNTSTPGTLIGVGDDVTFTPHFPLGFAFPMAGSANGTYTHFRVCTNGWLILTDGVNAGTNIPTSLTGTDAGLAGNTAGSSPRIAPFWRDLNIIAPAGVFYDNTTNPGVSCTIMWKNAVDFGQTTQKSIQAELFVTGEIRFSYTVGTNVQGAAVVYTGISPGNGQAIAPQSVLSAGAITAGVGMCFQTFATGTFDLGGKLISFLPDGTGGWVELLNGDCAFNQNYGTGCYDFLTGPTDSFYEQFTDVVPANARLQGNTMTLIPTGVGYTAIWGAGAAAGTYVAPTGSATTLPVGDDTSDTITPSLPVPSPFGAAAQLAINHNGIVTLGGGTNNPADWTPTAAEMLASTGAGFYSWYDYNNGEAGSGGIKTEEVGNVLYITWDGVEGFNAPAVVNPFTFQIQVDLATGTITYVWVTIPLVGYTGREMLVGYTDAGPSQTPTMIDLSTALPLVTSPDSFDSLALSASPSPVFTIGGPSVPITWTATNVIDAAPPFGIGVPLLLFSVAPLNPGVDLGFLGMPGCNLNIASIDVALSMPSTAPVSSLTLSVPQPLSAGLSFYAQVMSLFAPNSLPNGQNAFGAVLSNGVQSSFNTQ